MKYAKLEYEIKSADTSIGNPPPLSDHVLFQTNDLCFARDRVAQRFCRHRLEIVGNKQNFKASHHHMKGIGLTLNYIEYGAEVMINPGELGSFYLIQMPLAGGATIRNGRKEFHSTPVTFSILNPDLLTSMHWLQGCQQALIQIPKCLLYGYAESILGRKLEGSILFDPEINNGTPGTRGWMAISSTLFEIAEGIHTGSHKMWSAEDELNLLDLLLHGQPSNVSAFFDQGAEDVGQIYLRRADEFIRSQCSSPMTLLEISEAAGVTGRALQLAYKAQYGHSPMRALLLERLRRVRFELLASRGSDSVTDIAMKWGFSHLGRFSAAYKLEFGEFPSESIGRTLRF